MKYDPEKHHRHSIRLKGYDYSQAGAYFVTICTRNREIIFGNVVNEKMVLSEYGKILEPAWQDLTDHYDNIELDSFVVMPNHVHGIIILVDVVRAGLKPAPTKPALTNAIKGYRLSEFVRAFKTFSSRRINELRKTNVGAGLKPAQVWQRNYYEHVIRNEDELNCIREYIFDNPNKWELDRENPLSANYNLDYREYFEGIYDRK